MPGRATAPLLNSNSKCFIDVGPVELWATRWRRPSAAANPQGFCWPATPALTHFVAVVMLILIDCPSMKIGREQSSLGLAVAQLRCLWLALASLALFEPMTVAVHFEDGDVNEPDQKPFWPAGNPNPRAIVVFPVPLLPTAITFSRRATYSQRASSSTNVLLSEGIAANSKLSRLLTVGNRASLIRRSTIRCSRSINSSSARRSR